MTGSGPIIQLMMIALITFSIACWAIIMFKLILIKRAKKETKLFLEMFWTSKSLDEIYGSSENLLASPVAGVFKSGFAELEKLQKTKNHIHGGKKHDTRDLTHMSTELEGAENIARALKNAQNTECIYLEKYLPFLATTGSVAPFIGLFGTVWGLMDAFNQIGLKGSSNLAVVAPGISGALVTTAAGLAAAIPAVLAYNYFFNEVKLLETEMENFSFEFLNIIDRHLLTYESSH
jgi:biopolymer transport protein TolQ